MAEKFSSMRGTESRHHPCTKFKRLHQWFTINNIHNQRCQWSSILLTLTVYSITWNIRCKINRLQITKDSQMDKDRTLGWCRDSASTAKVKELDKATCKTWSLSKAWTNKSIRCKCSVNWTTSKWTQTSLSKFVKTNKDNHQETTHVHPHSHQKVHKWWFQDSKVNRTWWAQANSSKWGCKANDKEHNVSESLYLFLIFFYFCRKWAEAEPYACCRSNANVKWSSTEKCWTKTWVDGIEQENLIWRKKGLMM